MIKTPCILIGVSGGSGSGKTTFAYDLQTLLGRDTCTVLSQDHYYIDQSARFTGDGESVNFDHPDAIDFTLLRTHLEILKQGRAVDVPQYDFVTHRRLETASHLAPHPVVVLDGTLIFAVEDIRSSLDYRIFIDTPEPLRYERRFNRDRIERGREPEGIYKQFQRQVKPMHDLFVEPSKVHADQIVPGIQPFDEAILRMVNSLRGPAKSAEPGLTASFSLAHKIGYDDGRPPEKGMVQE